MRARITLLGNEGFHIATAAASVYIDAFYTPIRGVADQSAIAVEQVRKAHLILVTHPHPDHFSPAKVCHAARATGALVVGPRAVVEPLRDKLHNVSLVEMEPAGNNGRAGSVTVSFPGVRITAFRTAHSRHHNSYLVELHGFRFFHDGDNEDTRCLPIDALRSLDALLIGPWQGSGWVEFIEAIAPARAFLMHLTDAELAEHAAGEFLPQICKRAPKGLVVPAKGESYVFK